MTPCEEFIANHLLLSCEAAVEKKKVAPRSSLQFKVGPQFTSTVIVNPVYSSRGIQVIPELRSRIDRGFDLTEDGWVGYKRNYFTLVAAFDFQDVYFEQFLSESFHSFENGKDINLKSFAIKITSFTYEDNNEVGLIQHTAKRDKGPQFTPEALLALPGVLPPHGFIKEAANIRNKIKIKKINQILYYNKSNDQSIGGILDNYPAGQIAKVARYERLQFASPINHRRPPQISKEFKIRVELVGIQESGAYLRLAYIETPSLIIRGRSPSNYKHNNSISSRRKILKNVGSDDQRERINKSIKTSANENQKAPNLETAMSIDGHNKDDNSSGCSMKRIMSLQNLVFGFEKCVPERLERLKFQQFLFDNFDQLENKSTNLFQNFHSSVPIKSLTKDTQQTKGDGNEDGDSDEENDTSLLLDIIFDGLPKSPLDAIRNKHMSITQVYPSDGTGNTTKTAQSLKRESSGGSLMLHKEPTELRIKFSKYHHSAFGEFNPQRKDANRFYGQCHNEDQDDMIYKYLML